MPTDKSQITTWRALVPQASYGTESASGDEMRRVVQNTQTTFDGIGEPEFADNSEYDTGSDVADDTWIVKNKSSVNLPQDFNFQDIGIELMDAFGACTDSTLGSLYKHEFLIQNVDTSRQYPPRTILKRYGGIKIVMMPNGILTQLTISWGKSDKVKVQSQYTGNGRYKINPADYSKPALEADREYSFSQQVRFQVFDDTGGTKQVNTSTAAGSISGAGNISVTIASNLLKSTLVLSVAVAMSDTAALVAGKVRIALLNNPIIARHFSVSGSSTAIVLTARLKAANDTTLNIALATGTATGLTAAPSSVNTTPGVAPTSRAAYSCEVESGSLAINNPIQDGNRGCDEYLVADDPKSGPVASEGLVGKRSYMVDFTCRLESGDKMLDWLVAGKELRFYHRLFGTDGNGFSLITEHTNAKVVGAKEEVDGQWIVVRGKLNLLSEDGAIPLTAVLINDIATYSA
ncbi:MAG: hypothetical protein WA584_23350 [Pyrinomonadaceae bacterium]